MESVIAGKELQIERKLFWVEFSENARGRFLRITEQTGGRRNSVIVPSTGLEEFSTAISNVLAEAGEVARV